MKTLVSVSKYYDNLWNSPSKVITYRFDKKCNLVSIIDGEFVTVCEYNDLGYPISSTTFKNLPDEIKSSSLKEKTILSKSFEYIYLSNNTISSSYVITRVGCGLSRIDSEISKQYVYFDNGLYIVFEVNHESNNYNVYRYDDHNNIIYMKEYNGNEYYWEYEYDDEGNIIYKKYPNGDEWYYNYDDHNNIIYKKHHPDGNGYYWEYEYDDEGNVIREIDSDGYLWEFCYEYNNKYQPEKCIPKNSTDINNLLHEYYLG